MGKGEGKSRTGGMRNGSHRIKERSRWSLPILYSTAVITHYIYRFTGMIHQVHVRHTPVTQYIVVDSVELNLIYPRNPTLLLHVT